MPFVLDASTTMSWCFDDEASPESDFVLRQIPFIGAEVPALWHFENANVLAVSIRRQRLSAEAANVFLQRLVKLRIKVEERIQPVTSEDLLPLAIAYQLTAYDAAYLELARRKNYVLATRDKKLLVAAQKEGIKVFGSVQ
jgi:predicted nucleic acid-binding protein